MGALADLAVVEGILRTIGHFLLVLFIQVLTDLFSKQPAAYKARRHREVAPLALAQERPPDRSHNRTEAGSKCFLAQAGLTCRLTGCQAKHANQCHRFFHRDVLSIQVCTPVLFQGELYIQHLIDGLKGERL